MNPNDDNLQDNNLQQEDGKRYERVSRPANNYDREQQPSSAPRQRQRIMRSRGDKPVYGARYQQDGDQQQQQQQPRQQYPRQNNPIYSSRQDNYQRRNSSDEQGYQNDYQPRGRRPQGSFHQNNYAPQDRGEYTPRGNNNYPPRQQGEYTPRGNNYQPRGNNNYQPRENNGYQPRENNGYQPRNTGYQQRTPGYQPRTPGYQPRNNGYQPRNNGYNTGYQRPRQGFNKPAPRFNGKKRIEYEERRVDPTAPIRLNKFLANAGACSRREADDFIQAGVVSVNGEVVTTLGTKVLRTDTVLFHDQPVRIEKKVYILLNKPKNCVTTVEDPTQRNTVMDLVRNACPERIYPVGRLDRNTTGVLLLTNDGELSTRLTHPQYMKKKVYHVTLDKNISPADMEKLVEGIEVGENIVRADAVDYANPTDKKQVGVEIHSGRNHVVRRMFDAIGYTVTKLDRVVFCGLTKKNVKRGDWRFLTEKEVDMLYMGAFE